MSILANMMKGYSDRVLGPQAPDPNQLSDAYQKIQDTLAMNEKTQMYSHELDNNPNKGEYQETSPVERWRAEIDAMIKSGNPQLQKEGMSQMLQWQQQNNKEESVTAPKQSNNMLMAHERYPNDVTKRMAYFDQLNKKSSPVSINTGEPSYNPVYMTTEEKTSKNLNPDAPYYYSKTGKIYLPPGYTTGTEKTASLNSAGISFNNLDSMLFGSDGIMTQDMYTDGGWENYIKRAGIGNAQEYLKDDPRYANYASVSESAIGNFARGLGGEKGTLGDNDIARVMKMLPQVTGSNPDTRETAMSKMNVLKQLYAAAKVGKGLTGPEITKIINDNQKSGKDTPNNDTAPRETYESLLEKGWTLKE